MPTFEKDIPGARKEVAPYQEAVAMGSGATASLWSPHRDVTITAIRYNPNAALTGDATNNKAVEIRNEGTDGTGTTAIAPADTFGAGDDLVAQTPRAIVLSTTAADLDVDAGECVSAVFTEGGTGVAWPAGTWTIEYRLRNNS